jgi:WD40 repeat protein
MSATAIAGLANAVELRPSLTLRGACGQIASACFVGDTTLLAASDTYLHLIDARSGIARESVVESAPVTRLVASDDGSTFAFVNRSGSLVVRRRQTFDSADVIALDRFAGKLAIDASGTTVATAFGNAGAIVDLVRGEVVCELIGHHAQPAQERGELYDAAYISSVAISADGAIAMTGGSDARAIVWDVATAKALAVLEEHDGTVAAVGIDRKTTTVATIDGAGILRTATIAGRVLLEHRFPARSLALAFDHAGATLAVLLEDGTLVLLSRRGAGEDVWWQPTRTIALPKPYPYSLDISFDRSDTTIAVASPRNIATHDGWLDDSAIVLVTLATRAVREICVAGTSVRSLLIEESDAGATVFGASAHPMSWDLAGDGSARTAGWPPLFEAAVSPADGTLAAIGIDGALGVYERSGTLRCAIATAATPVIFAWSRTGDTLAAVEHEAGGDRLRLHRIDGVDIGSLVLGSDTSSIAFAPDGTIVVVSRTRITAYVPQTWKPKWSLERINGSCAFPRLGKAFFVSYSDEPIALYDFADGKRLATFDDGRASGGIDTSATGDVFITHGYGGSRLWSVDRRRVVARFADLSDGSLAARATFTRDGTRVVFNLGNRRDGGCATVFEVPQR